MIYLLPILQICESPICSFKIVDTIIEAYFIFNQPPTTNTFIFKLTNSIEIQHARNILSKTETTRIHIGGTIIKQPIDYNTPWSYHLDPSTIYFFQFSMEICDAHMTYIEEHLDEVGDSFLPNNIWCPWSSILIREL